MFSRQKKLKIRIAILQFQNRASGVVNAARDRDIRSLRGRITLQGNQLRICGAWGRESQKSRKLSELGH